MSDHPPAGRAVAARLPFDVVENPVTGERLVFTETGEKNGGVRMRFDFTVRPGGGVPTAHRHSKQVEVMRCKRGALHLTLDDKEVVLGTGEELTIPAGVTHRIVNRGAAEAMCEVEYRPAGKNADWFRLVHGFAYRHGRDPGLLDIAAFLPAAEILVPSPPELLQRFIVKWVLRPLSILLGRRHRMLATAEEVYGRRIDW